MKVILPSSELKNKPNKKPARSTWQADLPDYAALHTRKPHPSASMKGIIFCDVT
jgi:hypothetical protein